MSTTSTVDELRAYAKDADLPPALSALLRKAARELSNKPDYVSQLDSTYSHLAHLSICREQDAQLDEQGFISNGVAVTIKGGNSILERNNGFLQLATMALNAVASNLKENGYTQPAMAPALSDYLIAFAPWMQSFTNSYTVRNGAVDIEAFDLETYQAQPMIRLTNEDC